MKKEKAEAGMRRRGMAMSHISALPWQDFHTTHGVPPVEVTGLSSGSPPWLRIAT